LANYRAIGAIFYLGAVPKSALVNLTQIPLVLYPHLAAQYGDVDAVRAISQAMTEVFGELREGHSFSPEKQAMMDELVKLGKIDQSLATELAALAEGSFFQRGTNFFWQTSDKTALRIFKAQEYAMMLFQAAEKINRRVTAVSIFDLERKRNPGASVADITKKAKLSIDRTMFEYARYDRPKLFRGKKSVLFLFKTFMLKMGYFVGTDPGKWRYMLMMLLFAGYQGLPGMENILDVLDYIITTFKEKAGLKNPYTDLRNEGRNLIGEINDRTVGWGPMADVAAHGVSRYLGPFDISGSLSMGKFLPGTQYLNRTMPLRDKLIGAGLETAGALINIPLSTTNAVDSSDPSVWKQTERFMPNAVKNLSKSIRWATQGYETNYMGQPLTVPAEGGGRAPVRFDSPRGYVEIAGQALGFAPRRINEVREAEWAARIAVEYYKGRQAIILREYYNAHETKDEEMKDAVNERIKVYNESVPFPSMKITYKVRKASREAKDRTRNRIEKGKYPEKKYNKLYQEVIQDFRYSDPAETPPEEEGLSYLPSLGVDTQSQ